MVKVNRLSRIAGITVSVLIVLFTAGFASSDLMRYQEHCYTADGVEGCWYVSPTLSYSWSYSATKSHCSYAIQDGKGVKTVAGAGKRAISSRQGLSQNLEDKAGFQAGVACPSA